MDLNKTKILNDQIQILKLAVDILKSQINDIEEIGKALIYNDENESNKKSLLLVTKRNIINFYLGVLNFLVDKLESERNDFFVYYLPQVRVLIELYSYLHYLTNLQEEDQLILIITNDLYTLSSSVKNSKGDISEIQIQFSEQKKRFQYWLDIYGIKIPDNVKDLTKGIMEKQKLIIAPVDQRLKIDEILESCPVTTNLWKDIPSNVYDCYRKFSMYVHGNSLMSRSRGNENYWIISECMIFSSLIIELVNNRITNSSRTEEHFKYIEDVKFKTKDFIELWKINKL